MRQRIPRAVVGIGVMLLGAPLAGGAIQERYTVCQLSVNAKWRLSEQNGRACLAPGQSTA